MRAASALPPPSSSPAWRCSAASAGGEPASSAEDWARVGAFAVGGALSAAPTCSASCAGVGQPWVVASQYQRIRPVRDVSTNHGWSATW